MTEEFEQNKPIPLGEKLRSHFGIQSQYSIRYFDAIHQDPAYPYLGEGLRISNLESGDWHSVTIHPDDIAEAISRLEAVLGKTKQVPETPADTPPAFLPDWMKE